jgi:hypothetical protein
VSTVDRIFDRIVRKQVSRKNIVRVAAFGAGAALAVSIVHYITVKPGDSLSEIAQRACGNASDWTGIYAQDQKVIGNNPNLILAGQHLTFHCDAAAIKAAIAAPQPSSPTRGGYADIVAASISAPNGSMQACIISRESGGNPNIWNATGHWGLYQFSESTWVAHGGSAASFGNANAAVQTQVYFNTVATDGYSDWAPYDGC